MPNYKVINLKTECFLVTDQEGFESLIRAHCHNFGLLEASIMAMLIRDSVESGKGWEDLIRAMRIEKTDLPVCLDVKPEKVVKRSKLYPENSHQNYYENWHYLGNDGKHDYYVLPWEFVGTKGRFTAGFPLLSIVHSNEPSDYSSPCYKRLLTVNDYRTSRSSYALMTTLLVRYGYHLTGRNLPIS
jgi:hypothetical protein